MSIRVSRRSQADAILSADSGDSDQISFLTGVAIDPKLDLARQEFLPDCDIETVLRRHGGGSLRPAQPMGGFGAEVDYDVGLAEALGMIAMARSSYSQAPADIRAKFPNFGHFLLAVQEGRISVRDVAPAPIPEPLPPA